MVRKFPIKLIPWVAVYAAKEKKHGADIGEAYMNDKACKVFIQAIGEEMIEELHNLFKQKPFYCSILFDRSSDKSLLEREVLSLRLVENGLSRMKLLGVVEPSSGTGENIYKGIISKCEEHGLRLNKSCIAAGADGAAVNFGSNAGVLTRINADVPWLVHIHCVAHRLELALKDAFKGIYFEEIDDLMMQLYYMFKRSAKKWKQLRATAEILQEHVLKPARSHGTRWIDHRRSSLKTVDANLPSLVTMLEDMASSERDDISSVDAAKYKGYMKVLKSRKLVLFLAFYQDIVDDLADLSTSLQFEHLPISIVRNNILSTLMSLETKKNGQIQRTKKAPQQAVEANHWEYCGLQQLKHRSTDVSELEKQANTVLDNIRKATEKRFDFSEDKILQAAIMLDIKNFPTDKEVLATFGNAEIEIMINHFEEIMLLKRCDTTKILAEWICLKLDVNEHHKKLSNHEVWRIMLTSKNDRYPNVGHIC